MPANLNALIRYKTINSCLYGGKRKWSIRELIEACSEALAETRGRYEPISERTIRDDLRILKSDILGFNAPIEQDKGLYFYSDPQFSILSLKITDAGLADRIYDFLIGLRTEIQHPELESILKQLCSLANKTYEEPVLKEGIKTGRKDEVKYYSVEEYSKPRAGALFGPRHKKTVSSRESSITPIYRISDLQLTAVFELFWGDVFKKVT